MPTVKRGTLTASQKASIRAKAAKQKATAEAKSEAQKERIKIQNKGGVGIFERILDAARLKGRIPEKTKESREFFKNFGQRTNSSREEVLNYSDKRVTAPTKAEIGRMYFFQYDPKTKDKLPIYDAFPLIFMLSLPQRGKNGMFYFKGINMHYLPPTVRAKVMDAIWEGATTAQRKRPLKKNEKEKDRKFPISPETRLKAVERISDVIENSNFAYCFKTYLVNPMYLKSRLVKVYANEWDFALFLPLADFRSEFRSAKRNKGYATDVKSLAKRYEKRKQ